MVNKVLQWKGTKWYLSDLDVILLLVLFRIQIVKMKEYICNCSYRQLHAKSWPFKVKYALTIC